MSKEKQAKKYINFYVDEDKYEIITQRANKLGLPINQFCRSWILDRLQDIENEKDFKYKYIEQGEINLQLAKDLERLKEEIKELKRQENVEITSRLFENYKASQSEK